MTGYYLMVEVITFYLAVNYVRQLKNNINTFRWVLFSDKLTDAATIGQTYT